MYIKRFNKGAEDRNVLKRLEIAVFTYLEN